MSPKGSKFFELFNTNQEHAKFEIQLCPGHPIMCHEGEKFKIDAIAVHARIKFSHLSLELIQDIVLMISTKSEIKFIPIGLKVDKMMKDNDWRTIRSNVGS
eukprot:13661507-Ditylum_brightwellii.AAC.1